VVKNVAGFDLTRLMTGAWGTLGAITRVSLRLCARPAADETWAVPLDADDAARAERIGAFIGSHTPPVACELLDVALASLLGLGAREHLLVRLAGNSAFVGAARAAVSALGPAAACDAGIWTALRAAPRAATMRPAMSPGVRALNVRVKHAFDPANVLNPGIMG
jgi:glycolate oxidase FAD binding subunit